MADTIIVLHPGIEAAGAPVTTSVARPRVGAPRLASLEGKRIALLDNGKVNSGPVLVAIAKRLQARFGVAEFKAWKKRHAGDSGAAVIPSLVAWKPDLALTAIGD